MKPKRPFCVRMFRFRKPRGLPDVHQLARALADDVHAHDLARARHGRPQPRAEGDVVESRVLVAGEMAVTDMAVHDWFETHMHGLDYAVSISCAIGVVAVKRGICPLMRR